MRTFVLDINPEPWAIGPVGFSRRNGKMSAYVGRNQQLDAFKEAVREELGGGHELMEGPLELQIFFWRNLAQYATQSGADHRKHMADTTNLFKATEDACQGVLFANDRDVKRTVAEVVAQDAEIHPRIVVRLMPYVSQVPDEVMGLVMQGEDIFEPLDPKQPWVPDEEHF